MVFFGRQDHILVTETCVADKQFAQVSRCLNDSVLCAHLITLNEL